MLKRLFDIAVALALLITFLPVMAAVALLVAIYLGRPVFFTQVRPGKDGVPFTLFKFRTLVVAFDNEGHPLPDAQRMTKFGSLLRRLSLDELPQLLNVLRGDMSLVGPRPLLMEYLPLYNDEQARRHAVRPGITGWAQVNGRNDVDWPERFRLDVWYVDHANFSLDLRILLLTAQKVLKRSDVNQSGQATMSRFTGNTDTCNEEVKDL